MDAKPITLYEWIIERFTIAGRAEFVEQLAPTFEQLVEPRARVLDLCCGAGPFSFLFEQLEPVKIIRRFKRYRAEDSAIVETYRNEVTGEEYDYTGYLYTAPMVRRIVGALLALEQSIPLSERSFVDVFRNSSAPLGPVRQAARGERPRD